MLYLKYVLYFPFKNKNKTGKMYQILVPVLLGLTDSKDVHAREDCFMVGITGYISMLIYLKNNSF